MSNYYDEQRKVNNALVKTFKEILGAHKEIKLNSLKLEMTTKYAVSEKYVARRVETMLIEYPNVKVSDDEDVLYFAEG